MEKITKSAKTEHHYSERERQQAIENYNEAVVDQVHQMYDLYDQYLGQLDHKNFKSEKYDFELHNELSFKIEQVKRIVKYMSDTLRANYDVNIEDVDFDILLENYQANKK